MSNLLVVEGLETQFHSKEGVIHAVNNVSFNVGEGEVVGFVGESGSGKSVTMLSILRLIPSPPGKVISGKALFKGKDLLRISEDEIRDIRGAEISMIYQDPMTSFNPVLNIGRQASEPLEIHKHISHKEAQEEVAVMLDKVGIPNAHERMQNYPHQFSGGMRQRAMIAMALVCSPKIVIADEPTTALDVTIQAQIVDLVRRMRDEFGMAIIWITHDLGVIAGLAQRVLVMYGGSIVEEAPVKELFVNPQHPYTSALLKSLPRMDESSHRRLVSIKGLPPILYKKLTFCPFVPRCTLAIERCRVERPMFREVGSGHRVACWVNSKNGGKF